MHAGWRQCEGEGDEGTDDGGTDDGKDEAFAKVGVGEGGFEVA
jgi:hypothetical protein